MSKFERAVSEALIWIALFHAPISIGHTCTNLWLLCTVLICAWTAPAHVPIKMGHTFVYMI